MHVAVHALYCIQAYLDSQGAPETQKAEILQVIAGVGFKVGVERHVYTSTHLFGVLVCELLSHMSPVAASHAVESSLTSTSLSVGISLQDEVGSGGSQQVTPELACVQDADR